MTKADAKAMKDARQFLIREKSEFILYNNILEDIDISTYEKIMDLLDVMIGKAET